METTFDLVTVINLIGAVNGFFLSAVIHLLLEFKKPRVALTTAKGVKNGTR